MSNTEETFVAPINDDLDAFSSDFFGQKDEPAEPANPAVEDETVDGDDAPTIEQKDTQPEDDTLEDNDDTDEVEEEIATPKPKKNRFQERIDDLTGKAREAERREAAIKAELEAIKAQITQNKQTEPVAESSGPSPDDTNEDGTDKYPLGEFDPTFVRDLMKHELRLEREAIQREQTEQLEQQKVEVERLQLQTEWNSKLEPAQERYPDFLEKSTALVDSFSDLDPNYGEYLSTTIMSMDHGTEVLYYLANNPDEAKTIVNSGATKATIALGRIEAKFASEEKPKARPRVSQAPTPPPVVNKGSAVASTEVPDDTDDLDAFSAKLFKKRG